MPASTPAPPLNLAPVNALSGSVVDCQNGIFPYRGTDLKQCTTPRTPRARSPSRSPRPSPTRSVPSPPSARRRRPARRGRQRSVHRALPQGSDRGLDDTQLRNLETRLTYLRELEERRAAVLASIGEQGKLSDELRNDILAADTKSRLEDLYLPYKPKRRTRAQIAREAGLEPLADGLLADPTQDPQAFAAAFVNTDKGVADTKAALEGARAILMERWGEDAALVGELRTWLGETGVIRASVAEGKETEGAKYRDYFEHAESLAKIPSHRLLALFRARREEILFLELDPGSDAEAGHQYAEGRVARRAGIADRGRAADRWLLDACRLTWRAKLHTHLLLDLFNQAREKAEAEAIAVFGDNLKDLLLAAPAGPKTVLGWTRASAPAARSPWSMPQASWWPPTPSTRMSHVASGTSRCRRSRNCAPSTTLN